MLKDLVIFYLGLKGEVLGIVSCKSVVIFLFGFVSKWV